MFNYLNTKGENLNDWSANKISIGQNLGYDNMDVHQMEDGELEEELEAMEEDMEDR